MHDRKRRTLQVIAVLVTVAVLSEMLALAFAHGTVGAAFEMLLVLGFMVGNGLAALCALARRKFAAGAAFAVAWLAIVPAQAVLGLRLSALKHEAESVVAHLQAQHARSGTYAAGLDGYTFDPPWKREHFHYTASEDGQWFSLHWWVIDREIAYWYDAAKGYGYDATARP